MKMKTLSSKSACSLVMGLDRGEEAVEALLSLARQCHVKAGCFTELGAMAPVTALMMHLVFEPIFGLVDGWTGA